jgi:hypothetical protein
MIKYVVSINDKDIFENNISKYITKENSMIIENSIDLDSMAKKYNNAISDIELNGLEDQDIIVFVHEDVKLLDESFEEKLKMVFNRKRDVGLIGVYGTTKFVEAGGWWMSDRKEYGRGHIIQGLPDKEPFHMQDRIGFFDDVVSVDGCMIAIKGEIINEGFKFDETLDGYHFYDVDASFTILEMGYKVAVADVLIEHASEGPLNEQWEITRKDFVNKWKDKGYIFPVTVQQFID